MGLICLPTTIAASQLASLFLRKFISSPSLAFCTSAPVPTSRPSLPQPSTFSFIPGVFAPDGASRAFRHKKINRTFAIRKRRLLSAELTAAQPKLLPLAGAAKLFLFNLGSQSLFWAKTYGTTCIAYTRVADAVFIALLFRFSQNSPRASRWRDRSQSLCLEFHHQQLPWRKNPHPPA